MSAPALVLCAVAGLALALPVAAAGSALEARHRAAGAADAAALAAADAASGWASGEPCELAGLVAAAGEVELESCDVEDSTGRARLSVSARTPFGTVVARAHAGPEAVPGGVVGENGWAWPSGVRAVTQGFHDGYAIDLAVAADGALYAPYDGVVVASGVVGDGVPDACVVNPGWWRGPNHSVVMRHEFAGRTIFSSHNHIAPGSAVEPGTRVVAGQQVATSGMSGCTSGPHSHFTMATTRRIVDPDINPYDYLPGRAAE